MAAADQLCFGAVRPATRQRIAAAVDADLRARTTPAIRADLRAVAADMGREPEPWMVDGADSPEPIPFPSEPAPEAGADSPEHADR